MKKKTFFALVFLLVSRLVTFRLPFWSLDEAEYSVAGMVLRHGGALYRDVYIHHPPLIPYLYQFIFFLFGSWNLTAVHVVFLVSVLLNSFILVGLSKECWNAKAGFVEIFLFALGLAGFLSKDTLAANVELALNLMLSLSALFLLWGVKRKRFFWIFLAGVIWGVSLCLKQHALFFAPACIVLLSRHRGLILKSFASFFAGPVAVAAFFGVLFFEQGILEEAWFVLVGQSVGYLTFPARLGVNWMDEGVYYSLKGLIRIGIVVLSTWPLWWAARKKIFFFRQDGMRLFFLFWFWSQSVSLFLGGRLFWHYFLLLLPPLVVLGSAPDSPLKRLKLLPGNGWFWVAMLLPTIVFQLEAWGYLPLVQPYATRTCDRFLVEEIHRLTKEDDRIWIWGFMPQIYLESRRFPASRYLQCDPLSGLTRLTPGQFPVKGFVGKRLWADFRGAVSPSSFFLQPTAETNQVWALFWQDVQQNPPQLVIDSSPSGVGFYQFAPLSDFPDLKNWIHENYQLVGEICRFSLYLRIRSPSKRIY